MVGSAEAGLPGFEVSSWYGLSAATGTPPAIAARFRQIDAEPTPLGPAAYRAFIESEVALWAPIVASSGAVSD